MPCTESSSPGTTAVRYTDPNAGIVGISASAERGPDRARFGRLPAYPAKNALRPFAPARPWA
eukprot:5801816-Prymnesium_polylepis.1